MSLGLESGGEGEEEGGRGGGGTTSPNLKQVWGSERGPFSHFQFFIFHFHMFFHFSNFSFNYSWLHFLKNVSTCFVLQSVLSFFIFTCFLSRKIYLFFMFFIFCFSQLGARFSEPLPPAGRPQTDLQIAAGTRCGAAPSWVIMLCPVQDCVGFAVLLQISTPSGGSLHPTSSHHHHHFFRRGRRYQNWGCLAL